MCLDPFVHAACSSASAHMYMTFGTVEAKAFDRQSTAAQCVMSCKKQGTGTQAANQAGRSHTAVTDFAKSSTGRVEIIQS